LKHFITHCTINKQPEKKSFKNNVYMHHSELLNRILAPQYARPSTILGRFVILKLLNKHNRIINDHAFDILTPRKKDTILEIGFGGGYLMERLSHVLTDGELSGIDISKQAVNSARSRFKTQTKANKIRIIESDAESMPFDSQHFSKICSVNTIYYFEDLPIVINECSRLLKNKGLLAFCYTSKNYRGKHPHSHLLNYKLQDIYTFLENAHFNDIVIHSNLIPESSGKSELRCISITCRKH
jgi:SAM-dependent methyltransferase